MIIITTVMCWNLYRLDLSHCGVFACFVSRTVAWKVRASTLDRDETLSDAVAFDVRDGEHQSSTAALTTNEQL